MYKEIDRGYGQGDPRLGNVIEMDDSIYSLGFLSQISDKILDEEFDFTKGHLKGLDDDALDDLKHKIEHSGEEIEEE